MRNVELQVGFRGARSVTVAHAMALIVLTAAGVAGPVAVWGLVEGSSRVQEKSLPQPSWIGSQAGVSDEVLAPWTPLVVRTKSDDRGDTVVSVSCWDRTYEFGGQPFLIQVHSGGRPLLRDSVRLNVGAAGRVLEWESGRVEVIENTPARVRLAQSATAGTLSFSAEILLEYDGAVRFDWKLEPRGPLEVDELVFEIPLRPEHARYIDKLPRRRGGKHGRAGLLPAQGYRSSFQPFIWLGDEERGLAWFCESDEDWAVSDSTPTIEIFRRTDQVVLRLRLVNRPTRLHPAALDNDSARRELAFSFGIQATPVKPIGKDVWDYRLAHIDATYYGTETRLRLPEQQLDRLAAAGVKTLAFHEHWTDIESYISTT